LDASGGGRRWELNLQADKRSSLWEPKRGGGAEKNVCTPKETVKITWTPFEKWRTEIKVN